MRCAVLESYCESWSWSGIRLAPTCRPCRRIDDLYTPARAITRQPSSGKWGVHDTRARRDRGVALIALSRITKAFGQLVAIDDVSIEVHAGEIVALVGENGAGKSSLMNVAAGLYQPDSGEIRIRGERIRFKGPKDAIGRGVGMVHQHFMLLPTLTVAENVVLGMEPRRRGFLLDIDEACRQVEETCRRIGFTLDPRARVAELTVGSQQKVEIVKALFRGAKVLILDEPTAVLTPQEADELFAVARSLAKAGHAVIFISHKLREVISVASRIYVMRRGKLVGEVKAAETSCDALAALMVGDHRVDPATSEQRRAPGGPLALEVSGLTALGRNGLVALRDISLKVHEGEIVGIAGVDGNGQRELTEVLTGLLPFERGHLRIAGDELRAPSPQEVRRRRVSHVPEDRLLRAIVGPMTVEENVGLGRQGEPPFARGPWIEFRGRRERAESLLEGFDVRPRDPTKRIAALSGGNQQKVVVARELDCSPRLLVVAQPTRGLDIAAVAAVRKRLLAEREKGVAILLVSLDLEEVLALSDRIYVMYGGAVVGEVQRAEFDERRIGRLMLGARTPDEPGAAGVAHG
jgi:general nucleoside transport system ATP-binding protein